jgi:hypothetical protein
MQFPSREQAHLLDLSRLLDSMKDVFNFCYQIGANATA